MPKNLIRPVVAALFPLLLLAVLFLTASELLVGHGSPEAIRRAIPWNGTNAAMWRRVARENILSLDTGQLEMGAGAYRQALARNPLDVLAWEGLVTFETRLGGDQRAESALRGWVTAVPNSPRAAWTLANLLLRQGKTDESLLYLRSAAENDPALVYPVFTLARKLIDDPAKVLREVIPEDEKTRSAYLYYLMSEHAALGEIEAAWSDLHARQSPRVAEAGMDFAQHLASRGMGRDADRVWRSVAPRGATASEDGTGERLINGGFEKSVLDRGLDWLLFKQPGYETSLDAFTQAGGTRSLRIDFTGSANPDSYVPRQWVPVEPNQNYHFRAAIKTENLNSQNGVYWLLTDLPPPDRQSAEWTTRIQVGSNPWTVQELDIRTGPQTTVLVVQLRRIPDARTGAMLSGTVWVDDVSLVRSAVRR